MCGLCPLVTFFILKQNYIKGVASKYDLYRFVRFSSEVTEAKWDQSLKEWKVSIRVLAGKEAEACETYAIKTSFLVAGLGQLNEPYRPTITGEASFKGKIMHSARWDWSYDLRGKLVGIIGNGRVLLVHRQELLLTTHARRHCGTDRSGNSQRGRPFDHLPAVT